MYTSFTLRFRFKADSDAFHAYCESEEYRVEHYQLTTTAHFCTVKIERASVDDFAETWWDFIVNISDR